MMSQLGQFDPAQGTSRIAGQRIRDGNGSSTSGVAAPLSPAPTHTAQAKPMASATRVLQLAAQGAPVDTRLVDEIRTAISQGRYPLDPNKIAAAMIAVDMPVRT